MRHIKHKKSKETPKAKKTSPFLIFATVALMAIAILPLALSIVGDTFLSPRPVLTPTTFTPFAPSVPTDITPPANQTIPTAIVDTVVKKSDQKAATVEPKKVKEIPRAHLIIQKIGVDAVIIDMGITPEGAMGVPANSIEVGWFSLGTRPGETGSAVMAAHNRWSSKAGVFAKLNQLEIGDTLSVTDTKGLSTPFIVREMRTFEATDTDSGIYESKSGAHLNLVTCSGKWNPLTKNYTTRLVVFTDAVPTSNIVAVAK